MQTLVHNPSSVRAPAVSGPLAAELAGYLCGTHSRALDGRRGRGRTVAAIAARHASLDLPAAGESDLLGDAPWHPGPETARLRDRLERSLAVPGVVDLVLWGSPAHGGTTGFSDVDAVLVLADEVADGAAAR